MVLDVISVDFNFTLKLFLTIIFFGTKKSQKKKVVQKWTKMDKNDTMYPIGIHLGYFWIFLKKKIFSVLKILIEMVRFLKHFKMDIFWTKKKCPKKVANGQLF